MLSEASLEQVDAGFYARRLLVVGDLMLDRYVWGSVNRVSPEAPVPVLSFQRQTETPGGAANVALNLKHLGLRVCLVGIVGQDEAGKALHARLADEGIDTTGLVTGSRPSTCKTRLMAQQQQMLRLDQEDSSSLTKTETDAVLTRVRDALPTVEAVILSDYAKGVLTPEVCQHVISAARAAGLPVFVDPKGSDFDKYRGASLLTPNTKELMQVTRSNSVETLLQDAAALRTELDITRLALTRSEEGITVFSASGSQHYPATAQEVFDVSGAGDTVVATLAAAMISGMNEDDAVTLANLAAGLVIAKVGTSTTDFKTLAQAARNTSQTNEDKIMALDVLNRHRETWRSDDQRVVFTNGCFDLLHVGHITYLEQAKRMGDRLIIGLNTDRSVKRLKGAARPLITEQDRARVLAGLAAVDAVILFDDDTPLNLIRALKPDVLVKGSDYSEAEVIGGPEVKSWGGEVKLVQVVPGRSTTGIVEKMKHIS